ncbi:rhamnogalacturonan endolyase family protein [Nesterenkonia suensis]
MPCRRRTARTAAAVLAGTAALSLTAGSVSAGPITPAQDARPGHQLEALDRGLVAVGTDDGVSLSWRLLGEETSGATDHGMRGPTFHVLRDGERIATVNDSTNYLDAAGDADATYAVAPVGNAPHNGPDG